MTFIAALFALTCLWSLLSGRAYWLQRTVRRQAEPVRYWCCVAICAVMTLLFLALGPVR